MRSSVFAWRTATRESRWCSQQLSVDASAWPGLGMRVFCV
eukprot:COSAG02_NODE_16589_length_1072_cov_1.988695_1_plen_39_part_10